MGGKPETVPERITRLHPEEGEGNVPAAFARRALRLIYKHKGNLKAAASELGCSRQFLWRFMNGKD